MKMPMLKPSSKGSPHGGSTSWHSRVRAGKGAVIHLAMPQTTVGQWQAWSRSCHPRPSCPGGMQRSSGRLLEEAARSSAAQGRATVISRGVVVGSAVCVW